MFVRWLFAWLHLLGLGIGLGAVWARARAFGRPLDTAGLELKPDGSGLKCTRCHRVYPIKDDSPVMLIDEAKIEE